MTSATTKINNIVKSVFGEQDEFESTWTKNQKIQQQLKTIVNSLNSVKTVKDPNAPKRGKSSYLFFCGDMREKVKVKLGDSASATNITKELGSMWNILKASNKTSDKSNITKYQNLAVVDKERYQSEKDKYVPSEEFDKGKQRRKKDLNAPKRAKSAYLFFCNDLRDSVKQKHPGFKATETTSELGAMWNALKTDSSRTSELQKYEKMAVGDKVRYADEMKQKDSVSEVETEKKDTKAPVKKAIASKQKNQKKSNVDVSETRVLNGYQGFCQHNRDVVKKEYPKESAKDITKRLATMWKSLSVDEQTEWKTGCVTVPN
jgi:hypothetical protein